jgi:hypothetical protein
VLGNAGGGACKQPTQNDKIIDMFIRRLGSTAVTSNCQGGYACPDILELENGDFAVIGADITAEAAGKLPPGSGCSSTERIVQIPRRILVNARADIPAAL